jgi:hypothetical protein
LRDFPCPGVFKDVSKQGGKSRDKSNRRRVCRPNKTKRMKNMNKVLLATVVAVAFTAVNRINADESSQGVQPAQTRAAVKPLLSPRAQANQVHVMAGDSTYADTTTIRPAGNARAWESARSLMKAPGTDTTDLAHGPTPTMSPKDPNYAQALREMREVQIAPLK